VVNSEQSKSLKGGIVVRSVVRYVLLTLDDAFSIEKRGKLK